jgi:hypothetical protein
MLAVQGRPEETAGSVLSLNTSGDGSKDTYLCCECPPMDLEKGFIEAANLSPGQHDSTEVIYGGFPCHGQRTPNRQQQSKFARRESTGPVIDS